MGGVNGAAGSRLPDPLFWRGKRVLLTGHTGFKGAWASLWLKRLGADVHGLALAPTQPRSLYGLACVPDDLSADLRIDIRDRAAVAKAVEDAAPEIVLHLAAEALVRRAARQPVETYDVNVMGTAHLLEALRTCKTVKTVLIVTSDKVYRNLDDGRAFGEDDPLGGHDPYSASKAAQDILARSYAETYLSTQGVALATARGGNVIGGGDFSEDRIIPDIWRALEQGAAPALRSPNATRPWQHALDCLSGYFLFTEDLHAGVLQEETLNFGPAPDAPVSVAELTQSFLSHFDSGSDWTHDAADGPKEMALLSIDAEKARSVLNWGDRLQGRAAIKMTAAWYGALFSGEDMGAVTRRQLETYAS
ncbi:MAG: CDP-glucose 4,6-dehydratase [Pseudomonadota bacterium]